MDRLASQAALLQVPSSAPGLSHRFGVDDVVVMAMAVMVMAMLLWTGSHPKPHSFKSLLPHQVLVIVLVLMMLW